MLQRCAIQPDLPKHLCVWTLRRAPPPPGPHLGKPWTYSAGSVTLTGAVGFSKVLGTM